MLIIKTVIRCCEETVKRSTKSQPYPKRNCMITTPRRNSALEFSSTQSRCCAFVSMDVLHSGIIMTSPQHLFSSTLNCMNSTEM